MISRVGVQTPCSPSLFCTYKLYSFWTVCFLTMWYKKPDSYHYPLKRGKRRLPVFAATLRMVIFKHGTRDMMTWLQETERKSKRSRNFSRFKTKTIYNLRIMSEKMYIIHIFYIITTVSHLANHVQYHISWISPYHQIPSTLCVCDLMIWANPLDLIQYTRSSYMYVSAPVDRCSCCPF